MISRADHISIAVTDYHEASDFFQKIFGAVPGAEGTDNSLKYFWKIFSIGDLTRIELIAPTGTGSFLKNFLGAKKNGGVHHITFETQDIYGIKKKLEDNGIPYFGFKTDNDQWKELFIHPKDAFGVLIQIAQFNPKDYLDSSVKLPTGHRWSVKKKDNGAMVEFAHPGGGKVSLELTKAEISELVEELMNSI